MPNNLPQPDRQLNPNVSCDCVIFGFDFDQLNVLLIDRLGDNGNGRELMLPGDLIQDDENLDQAAERVLKELTGLENIYLEQFSAFGDPNRVRKEKDADWLRAVRAHPEVRVITVAYYSLIKQQDFTPKASSFAKRAEWVSVTDVPELGFDHNEIFEAGLQALKNKVQSKPVGFELLPEKFTLGQLQKLYEAVLGTPLDKRNFRRKILNLDILVPLKEKQQGVPHKPARYYRFDDEKYQQLRSVNLDFGI